MSSANGLKCIRTLPAGTRCRVSVIRANDGKEFVVKKLHRPSLYEKQMRNEYDIMRRCSEVRDGQQYVIEAYSMKDGRYLLCEYANQGDLFTYMFDDEQELPSFRDAANYLLRGLSFLHHRCDVYHGDIKMENVVVHRLYNTAASKKEVQLKYIDFEDSIVGAVEQPVTVRPHLERNKNGGRPLTLYSTIGHGNDDRALWDRGFDKIPWPLGKQDIVALGKTLLDMYLHQPHQYASYSPSNEEVALPPLERSLRYDTPDAWFYAMNHTQLNEQLRKIDDPYVLHVLRKMTATDPRDRPWARELFF